MKEGEEIPTKSIMVEGRKIVLYQIGQGSPVILLHGLVAKGAWSLKHLARKLANHFLVTGIHLPGYEDSEESEYKSLEELAEILVPKLLETLKIEGKIHLFGASTGGTLAIVAATKFPERIAKLALYEALFASWNAWRPWRIVAFFALVPGFIWTLRAILTQSGISDFTGVKSGSSISAIIRLGKLVSKADLTSECQEISQLEIPTLLGFGQESSIFLSLNSMKQIVKLMPGAEQIEIEGANHTLRREFQEKLADYLIEFFLD